MTPVTMSVAGAMADIGRESSITVTSPTFSSVSATSE